MVSDYKKDLLKRLQDPGYASEYLKGGSREEMQELLLLALRELRIAKTIEKAEKEGLYDAAEHQTSGFCSS